MPADILYLMHRLPYPPDKGDRIRNYHVLRFLSRRARVHVACLADEPFDQAKVSSALVPLCAEFHVIPIGASSRWIHALASFARGQSISIGAFDSSSLRELIRRWCLKTRFDAAIVSASSLAPYLSLAELCSVPSVVDLVDVDSQKWFDYSAASRGLKSWLYRCEGTRLRRLEAELPNRVHAVTLVSEAEASLYRTFCKPGTVQAIVNGVDLDYFQPHPGSEQSICVFVGALDYRPNVDAVNWFAREVWPMVRQQVPQARLKLVGRRPVSAVSRLASIAGITVVGGVPDIRPYLQEAAVAIAPLRIARGLQNKVLEALAMGKAVVASPPALMALNVSAGTHLLSASSPNEWAASVLCLLSDSQLRQRLGEAGRHYAETHHHWEICLAPFASLLRLPAGISTHSDSDCRV